MGSRRRPRSSRVVLDIQTDPQKVAPAVDQKPAADASGEPRPEPAPSQQATPAAAATPSPSAPAVTGQHARVTGQHARVTGQHARVTGQHERVTGQHERSTTGRQPRVELVTRQADDGSYEMVFETVGEGAEDEDQADIIAPMPLWKRKPLYLVGAAALVLISIIGVTALGISLLNKEPKKVAVSKTNATTSPDGDSKKRYEYVPPKNTGDQKLKDEEIAADKEEADKEVTPKPGNATAKPTATPPEESARPPSPPSSPGPLKRSAVTAPSIANPSKMFRPDLNKTLNKPVLPELNKAVFNKGLNGNEDEDEEEGEEGLDEDSEETDEEGGEEDEEGEEDGEEGEEEDDEESDEEAGEDDEEGDDE